MLSGQSPHRILVVDDNQSIHEDFRKILGPAQESSELDRLEASLFGESAALGVPGFEVESAFQGEEGIARVRAARRQGRPYAVAFVDIRMPPGLDGVETAARLWLEDEELQVVLCSAYTDYSWEQVVQKLGLSQRLLILRKPFDTIEVRQMAYALAEKWELLHRTHQQMEVLSRLAAGVAHEVNNPLSFILSNLSYVRTELEAVLSGGMPSDPGELRDACNDAYTGAQRIRRVVQGVMRFGRGKEPQRQPIPVHPALEEAVAMAELGSGIRLVRDYEQVPPVWAGESDLSQVFLNLLLNAAQALRNSGCEQPLIRLCTRVREDGRVAVEVQDNGPGIAPEHMERIFEPFFTTRPVGEGTGLGLSICHGIITSLGGELRAQSAPGQGATFQVLLPRAPVQPLMDPGGRDNTAMSSL